MYYCGIVGYTGTQKESAPILLKGLEKLEYRGYDSAGVFIPNQNETGDELVRQKGRVADLEALLAEKNVNGKAGIAHTRWATHGEPSVKNSHPQYSEDEQFYLVHNGVIENFMELKEEYLSDVNFHSDTDTEVAVQLISKFAREDNLSTFDAFQKAINLFGDSAYGFLLMDQAEPERMYVAKRKSPLLIGVGADFNVVTSDAVAMLDETHDFIELLDGEVAIIDPKQIQLFNANGEVVVREPFHLDIDASETDKGIYPYYMLKEVDEQPVVMRRLMERYFDAEGNILIGKAILDEIHAADRIYIIAAGTSYHAGLAGARLFEQWSNKPTSVFISSEFAYEQPLLSEKPFFIFLSQSGETADSREVLQNINEAGYHSLTLTNVEKSTLWREATYALPLLAGPEIAVASTKAYIAQVTLEAILAYSLAGKHDLNLMEELSNIAVSIQAIVDDKDTFKQVADEMLVPASTHSAFYIGRGVDSSVALEAALKLKEISYVQAEGFAAGELKHGTLALIEEGTPVMALITQPKTAGLVRGNLSETTARGARPYTIVSKSLAKEGDGYILPDVDPLLAPLVEVIPTQLLAYYTSLGRGLDVDRPRNLAKSVTVQ